MSSWQKLLKELQDYIASHPDIHIGKSGVSIPSDVRDEFYRQFDAVRKAFIESHYGDMPVEIEALSKSYLTVEKEVRELLKLDTIITPIDLLSFLRDPAEGLSRSLFNKLFDLLQGKISGDFFEEQALEELQAGAMNLYSLGYELWAALSLIKLLEPDNAFQVALDEEDNITLTELKEISFGRQAHHSTLRLPEFIVHSRALNKFVSVKMGPTQEIIAYTIVSNAPRRPRRTGDSSLALTSRAMILSAMETTEKIPIIADLNGNKIQHPDLVMECASKADLEDTAVLDQVKQHHNILQPRAGIYLICSDSMREAGPGEPESSVRIIAAGLDPSRLRPLIDSLSA
jgi:hypothetical protein